MSEAPRDSASRPRAPLPAKASSTRAFTTGFFPSVSRPASRMLNRASRLRSDVGRTSCPSGTCSRRPRYLPPTMRMRAFAGFGAPRLAANDGRTQLLAKNLRRDLLNIPFGESAKLKGPIGYPHQAINSVAQMFTYYPDLPVLALPQTEGQPGIAADLIIQSRLNGTIGNAINRNALRQPS